MSKTTVSRYRVKFPRIRRVLEAAGILGEETTVSVINSVNGEVLSSREFDDSAEATSYYSGEYADLRSAEECAIMCDCIESLSIVQGEIKVIGAVANGENMRTSVTYLTVFEHSNRSLFVHVGYDGKAVLCVRKIDTCEIIIHKIDKDAARVIVSYDRLFAAYSAAENLKDAEAGGSNHGSSNLE